MQDDCFEQQPALQIRGGMPAVWARERRFLEVEIHIWFS
jgi:hypothetical protein